MQCLPGGVAGSRCCRGPGLLEAASAVPRSESGRAGGDSVTQADSDGPLGELPPALAALRRD
eukprot:2602204-Rhodomonas_salina.1